MKYLKKITKGVSFTGDIIKSSGYHHGDMPLWKVIVNMC